MSNSLLDYFLNCSNIIDLLENNYFLRKVKNSICCALFDKLAFREKICDIAFDSELIEFGIYLFYY